MATNLGTAVNFGFITQADGATITGYTGYLLQSADLSRKADEIEVRDAAGEVKSVVYYNSSDDATLEFVYYGTSQAAAITNTALKTVGALVVISACASIPDLVQTTWQLKDHKISGSNTDVKKATLTLKRNPNVTATAT